VGLVLEQPVLSRANDPVEYGAYLGLLRARRKLHIQAKVALPRPNVYRDLGPFDFLAGQHYNLVIADSFLGGLPVAARMFPGVRFAALDAAPGEFPHALENLEEIVFHTEQAAYLAGFVAASMADKRRRPHVVGAVGVRPQGEPPEPQVQAYIAGFQAGAKRADPKITVLKTYTHDFLNEASCRNAALRQIDRGSKVVFDVAGDCGIGALKAAQQRGAYGIGVDSDQSYLGKYILTSAVLNLKLAVYDLANLVVHRRLRTGGIRSFDLKDHGVGLGQFSKNVSLALQRELIPLKAKIELGKIMVPATLSRSRWSH
jgi:basic membrane protein A and related proteins